MDHKNSRIAQKTLFLRFCPLLMGLISPVTWAADECGVAFAGGVILCDGDGAPVSDANPYNNGISYTIDGLTLNVGGAATTINAGTNSGIRLVGTGNGALISNIANTVDINTVGGFHAEGIEVRQNGTGAITVNSDADIFVTGNDAEGIVAWSPNILNASVINITASGDIETQGVNASGVFGYTRGTGAINVVTTSDVTTAGTFSDAVLAWIDQVNSLEAVTLNVNSGVLHTTGNFSAGITGYQRGQGAINITSLADITTDGSASHGILANPFVVTNTGTTTINVDGGTIITNAVDSDGILAESSGTGNFDINLTAGTVTSGGSGIHTVASAGGTLDIAAGFIVDGSNSGIALRDGDRNNDGIDVAGGNIVATSAGTLIGNVILGLGNDIFNLSGGSLIGDIVGDDAVASISDGDDTFNWNAGALDGGFLGQNGSDRATISDNAIYDGDELLDGGDDVAVADGYLDALRFRNLNSDFTASRLVNWERIHIENGTMHNADNSLLTTGSGAGLGLIIENAGVLDASTEFNLSGDLTLLAGGMFDGRGGGPSNSVFTGNVTNNGVINLQDSAINDSIVINGNYTGAGLLLVDADFSTALADTVTINGVTTGSTAISVQNASTGIANGNDVQIINVSPANTHAGDFFLAADVAAGAYVYNSLIQNSNGWALQGSSSAFTRIASAYEVLGHHLLSLETMPTLDQRDSIRHNEGLMDGGRDEKRTTWLRVSGAADKVKSNSSTTGADFDSRLWQVKIGAVPISFETKNGLFLGGIRGGYSQISTDVDADEGNSHLKTDSYNIGLSATWYDQTGTYVDGQVQRSWYRSDIHSGGTGGGKLNNIHGDGYSVSIEVGKEIKLSRSHELVWGLTPQAQLIYSEVDSDDFIGTNKESVSLRESESLTARIGLALEGDILQNRYAHMRGYLLANLIHDFKADTRVDVSSAVLENKIDRSRAEVGGGVSYEWNKGVIRYEMFGELSVNTSLNNVGESNTMEGSVGFKMKF